MNVGGPPAPPVPQLRTVQRDLVGASDEQVMQVVAMVDSMAERGGADALIAPLRDRLMQLQPARPLTFARLVFAPLDPVIVPGTKWRRGGLGIPRTAVAPIAGVVLRGIGAAAGAIQARIAGQSTRRTDIIAAAGAQLWPAAAEMLAEAPPPEDWTEVTGLPPGDYIPLAQVVAALLGEATRLQRVARDAAAGIGPDAEKLAAMLAGAGASGPEALALMIALLMARLPRTGEIVLVADDHAARQADPAARTAAERAVTFVLEGIESVPALGPRIGQAVVEIEHTVALLADLAGRAGQRPGRLARIEQTRREVDLSCRDRFTSELDSQLLAPAAGIATASDHDMANLEAAARDLRRFETTARRIGGAEQYDRQLRRAAEALRPVAGEERGALVDRARLVEILQGPEAALALLAAGGV